MNGDKQMATPKSLAFNFMTALAVATEVFAKYKADQLRWWKRMDGTPILNDVCCRMAEAFCDYAKTGIESHAQRMKAFLEELAPYLGVDGEGDFKPRDLIDAAAKIRESCNFHHALVAQLGRLVEPEDAGEYESEYDGRTYTACVACHYNERTHTHAADCEIAKARVLFKATKGQP